MRRITYEWHGSGRGPLRGDRLRSTRSTYYVLHSRTIRRRDPEACPKFALCIENVDELPTSLRGALLRSAIRRDASILFHLRWDSRRKKTVTFEELMRR